MENCNFIRGIQRSKMRIKMSKVNYKSKNDIENIEIKSYSSLWRTDNFLFVIYQISEKKRELFSFFEAHLLSYM